MPEREEGYEAALSPYGDKLWARWVRDGKAIIRFSVQFEAMIDGVPHPVVRYDTAHGYPHRDTLD